MSDFYGRRRVYALGVAAFGVLSVLCGAAPNMELLILFRFLQGAAGAFLVPGSLARSESTRLKLQSPMYLVCRLLLEKKNKRSIDDDAIRLRRITGRRR